MLETLEKWIEWICSRNPWPFWCFSSLKSHFLGIFETHSLPTKLTDWPCLDRRAPLAHNPFAGCGCILGPYQPQLFIKIITKQLIDISPINSITFPVSTGYFGSLQSSNGAEANERGKRRRRKNRSCPTLHHSCTLRPLTQRVRQRKEATVTQSGRS